MIGQLLELRRLRRVTRLPAAQVERIRDRRLRAVVHHAYDNVPYYRELFRSAGIVPDDIRTAGDLVHVPLTAKADLRHAGEAAIVASNVEQRDCATFLTSGTTGEPFRIRVGLAEWQTRRMIDMRTLLASGVRARDEIVILGPEHRRPHRLHDRLGLFRTSVVPGTSSPEEMQRALRALRPTVLWAYPTALRALLHGVGYRLEEACRPRILITGTEMFDPVLRSRIDPAVETFNFYGTNEVGRIAHECKAHDGMHVNIDHAIVECLDLDTGAPTEATGEIVVTSLTAYAMPFIRYRVGDLTAPRHGACPCGSPFPRIEAPSGRVWDMITLPSGRLFAPMACATVLRRSAGIDQYRLTQVAPDRIVVELVPGAGFCAPSLAQLGEELVRSLGEPVAIEFRTVDFIRSRTAKFKVFESLIESARN
ncbi:phenylacetate-CoA ligase [Burkholderiales bacterium]|nr:phenylacetate-CoA ligase [Burkholderiales bacterium]